MLLSFYSFVYLRLWLSDGFPCCRCGCLNTFPVFGLSVGWAWPLFREDGGGSLRIWGEGQGLEI